MNDINPEYWANLLDEARTCLDSSQQIMDELLNDPATEEPSSLEDSVYKIQLLLQYRLDCQNTLALLIKFDENLLYILGIQSMNSAEMNLDRLAYALGDEDLQQMLNVLSMLVHSLLKIIHRYQKEQVTQSALKNRQNPYQKQNRMIKGMQKLSLQQKRFLSLIHQLQADVQQLLEFQSLGPVFDHIAALRGPISHFYQATLHGLGKTKPLYQKINATRPLNQHIDSLLKKLEEVLHTTPAFHQAPLQHSLEHFAPKSSEELEQRASAKRLRPFF